MTRYRNPLGLALAAAALAAIAGCSSTTQATVPSTTSGSVASTSEVAGPSGASTNSATPTITIAGFMFSDLTVSSGVQVTVKNTDSVAHTVTVHGTELDVKVDGGGQATFTAPAKAGAYPLTCDVHPSMRGTLTVTG
jgi:plastocyanin